MSENEKPEKPVEQTPEAANENKKSGLRGLFNFKRQKIEFDSRAFAGLATLAGGAFLASRYVPPLRPWATVLKGTAFVAMGAADARRLLEQDNANANHQLRSQELLKSAGEVRGKDMPELSQRDYIVLSFLPDNQLQLMAWPVQAEVLKVQILLDLDTAHKRSLKVPEKIDAVKKGDGLHSEQGVEHLRSERAKIRDILDGKADGQFDEKAAAAAQREQELKGLMRLASMEAFRQVAKRAGRYGSYFADAFNVVDGATLLKESTSVLVSRKEKHFETAEDYLAHLETRVKAVQDAEGKKKSVISGLLPRFGK